MEKLTPLPLELVPVEQWQVNFIWKKNQNSVYCVVVIFNGNLKLSTKFISCLSG